MRNVTYTCDFCGAQATEHMRVERDAYQSGGVVSWVTTPYDVDEYDLCPECAERARKALKAIGREDA